jgi:hypothetical protein
MRQQALMLLVRALQIEAAVFAFQEALARLNEATWKTDDQLRTATPMSFLTLLSELLV